MSDRQAPLAALESAGVKAWPALETADLGGWLWRYSSGGSQRANSVATLAFDGRDVAAAIADVEARYRRVGAAPRFQITGAAVPSDLDALLAARGYRINDPCTTLARAIAPDEAWPDGAETTETPTPDWLAVYGSVLTEDRARVAPRILARVPRPRAFCAVRRDGRVVSTALAVADGPVAVAECVATAADVRRQGAAAAVMQAVAAWAARQGAHTLTLGAVATNIAAQQLYARSGFTRAGLYHIRVLDR